MTAPTRLTRGSIGSNAALAINTPYEFQDFQAPQDAQYAVIFFRTTRSGTVRVTRFTAAGVEQQAIPDVPIPNPPAADEYRIELPGPPLGRYRLLFTNAAVGVANISAEATWLGGRQSTWSYEV